MKIGLTGGIGCGKTTACEMFARLGWSVLLTDRIASDLISEDPEVADAIRGRWGHAVESPDGTLDRKAIARLVFNDETELTWLETLLHPRVRQQWTSAVNANPGARWLIEIPLLFEKRLESHFDLTVCLECPDSVVRERMVARGYTADELALRRTRQLPLDAKIRRADCVLSNSGSLEFLELQISKLNHRVLGEKA